MHKRHHLRIFIIQPNFLTEKRDNAFLCLENKNAQRTVIFRVL